MPEQWTAFLEANVETLMPIFIGLIMVFVALALVMIRNYLRIKQELAEYNRILERFGEREIQEELGRILYLANEFGARLESEEQRGRERDRLLKEHGEHLRAVLQRIGLVRYNAFPDVAGDQSYSLALLDLHGDGVVLTTLHGRAEARTYAKKVTRGASSYPLLPEEQQAIFQAMQSARLRGVSSDAAQDKQAYLLGRRDDMPLQPRGVASRYGDGLEVERAVEVQDTEQESAIPVEEPADVAVVTAQTRPERPIRRESLPSEPEVDWPEDQQIPPPPWSGMGETLKKVRPFGRGEASQSPGLPRHGRRPPGAVHVVPTNSDSSFRLQEEGRASLNPETEAAPMGQSKDSAGRKDRGPR